MAKVYLHKCKYLTSNFHFKVEYFLFVRNLSNIKWYSIEVKNQTEKVYMLKKLKYALIFIFILVSPCILNACNIEMVSSISMVSDTINSYAIGEFSYDDYKVKVL